MGATFFAPIRDILVSTVKLNGPNKNLDHFHPTVRAYRRGLRLGPQRLGHVLSFRRERVHAGLWEVG
jgi:hypothetical protein